MNKLIQKKKGIIKIYMKSSEECPEQQ